MKEQPTTEKRLLLRKIVFSVGLAIFCGCGVLAIAYKWVWFGCLTIGLVAFFWMWFAPWWDDDY